MTGAVSTDLLPPRMIRLTGRVIAVGELAGTDLPHPHAPDDSTGTSCMACFGWSNDARHLGHEIACRRPTGGWPRPARRNPVDKERGR